MTDPLREALARRRIEGQEAIDAVGVAVGHDAACHEGAIERLRVHFGLLGEARDRVPPPRRDLHAEENRAGLDGHRVEDVGPDHIRDRTPRPVAPIELEPVVELPVDGLPPALGVALPEPAMELRERFANAVLSPRREREIPRRLPRPTGPPTGPEP